MSCFVYFLKLISNPYDALKMFEESEMHEFAELMHYVE